MCLKCAPAVGPAPLCRVPAGSPSVPAAGNWDIPGPGNRGIPGPGSPSVPVAGNRGIPGRRELAVLRQEAVVYSPNVLQKPGMVWVGR
ncbi:hypothetical protein Nmel_012163, partial [Mimus melanotis]